MKRLLKSTDMPGYLFSEDLHGYVFAINVKITLSAIVLSFLNFMANPAPVLTLGGLPQPPLLEQTFIRTSSADVMSKMPTHNMVFQTTPAYQLTLHRWNAHFSSTP